jgi:hypothetical protein
MMLVVFRRRACLRGIGALDHDRGPKLRVVIVALVVECDLSLRARHSDGEGVWLLGESPPPSARGRAGARAPGRSSAV